MEQNKEKEGGKMASEPFRITGFNERIDGVKLIVTVFLLAIGIYLFMLVWQTLKALTGNQHVLQSRRKKINHLITKKSSIKKWIDISIKFVPVLVRIFLVTILVLLNYFIGHEKLGYDISDINSYLALNTAFAFVVAVCSFLLYGSKKKLDALIDDINNEVRTIVYNRIPLKYKNIAEQIDAHKNERKKIEEELGQTGKDFGELGESHSELKLPQENTL